MYYYIILLVAIVLFAWLEYSERKEDYLKAKQLNKEFNDWVFSTSEHKKPSNALFTELYKKRYGEEQFGQGIVSQQGHIISTRNIDVIASFPTTTTAIAVTQMSILDNLEDYYRLKFEETKSIKFFILFVLSIPLKILKYMGFDEDKASSKIFQVIIWIVGLFLPPLKDLLLQLLRIVLNSK